MSDQNFISKKAAEVSIEGLQRSIESATQATNKEIFYYNFSLVALQLYILNKVFDFIFTKGELLSEFILEIVIICLFVFAIILAAIISTIKLLKSYHLSKLNNFNSLNSLISQNYSEDREQEAKKLNHKIDKKYQLADLLCKTSLCIFLLEIFSIVLKILLLSLNFI